MVDLPEPGIYFDMPEDQYHAAPALGSTGVRNLLISPLDFWTESRLNPGYVDEKTNPMILGTAFHRRLLEPARFAAMYGAWPRSEDYPNAVDGGKALQALCGEMDLKKSGTIAAMCERILEANPDAELWPVIEAKLIKDQAGLILLKQSEMGDIERVARIVAAHPSATKAITGGYPEVSIFWVDEETGVPLKIRTDYLKVKIGMDVKSFSNPMGKPIAAAVASAVAYERYGVQAVIYATGIEAGKAMLRSQGPKVLHGADAIENDWLLQFAACKRHSFGFLFVQSGKVNNVKLREFRQFEVYGGQGMSQNAYWTAGVSGFRKGLSRYVECMKKFGLDTPWTDDEPMKPFVDEDFPLTMFNEAA